MEVNFKIYTCYDEQNNPFTTVEVWDFDECKDYPVEKFYSMYTVDYIEKVLKKLEER